MKTNTTVKIIAVAVVAAIAVPLSASAGHHSEDIIAGAAIGVIAGALLVSAAEGSCQYAPPPPQYYAYPRPPPQYYAPPPPPQYYGYPPPPPTYYGHRPPPPPQFYGSRSHRHHRY